MLCIFVLDLFLLKFILGLFLLKFVFGFWFTSIEVMFSVCQNKKGYTDTSALMCGHGS